MCLHTLRIRKSIIYLQRLVKLRIVRKKMRLVMLNEHWNLVLHEVKKEYAKIKIKDKKIKAAIKGIEAIPEEIKLAVITKILY